MHFTDSLNFVFLLKHFYVKERKYIANYPVTKPHFEIAFNFWDFFLVTINYKIHAILENLNYLNYKDHK